MGRLSITLIVCAQLLGGMASAQQPSLEASSPEGMIDREKWDAAYLTIVKQFQVTAGNRGDITLVPESLLHWENPVRVGRTEGNFYVWTDGTRPVLVGTVFSYDSPVEKHDVRALAFELHTLIKEPLRVERNGDFVWMSPANSLAPIPLPDLPPPRPRRSQRLVEMRRIARRLRATTTLSGEEQVLRLLPTPIHRFNLPDVTPDDAAVQDGAVFALVTGTDPELLVFIESVRNTEETFSWQVTPARFTNLSIKLNLDDTLLWDNSVESNRTSYRPYVDRHRIYHLPTALGAEAMEILDDSLSK
jgi:hypothetical protein